jgi:hypothetical protein
MLCILMDMRYSLWRYKTWEDDAVYLDGPIALLQEAEIEGRAGLMVRSLRKGVGMNLGWRGGRVRFVTEQVVLEKHGRIGRD